MQKKTILVSIAIIAIAVTGAVLLFGSGQSSLGNSNAAALNNVSTLEGNQIVTIKVKAGYAPKVTTAKAGVPTTVKFQTQNTFDCSSALSIPSLGYQKNLPPSGETTVDIPAQESGSSLTGICSMGMYSFTINFN